MDGQRQPKAKALDYLRSQKYDTASPNFTVTAGGGHPAVKGNGYVPYYMVFDHHGVLRREHMCGDYHGGDGLGMIEWVDRLLRAAPGIYLGKEPFEHAADLAAKIEEGKNLARPLAELAKRRKGATGALAAELDRLETAVIGWRDQRLKDAERALASKPSTVLASLGELAKALGRSPLAAPVAERVKALKADRALKDAIAIEKRLAKAQRKLSKLKACKGCRRQGIRKFATGCPTCRADHERTIAKMVASLHALAAKHETLPITKALRAFAGQYEK